MEKTLEELVADFIRSGSDAERQRVFEIILPKIEGLLHRSCRRYHIDGYDYDDLLQQCRLRLWRSLHRWNPLHGCQVTTFVVHIIENELKGLLARATLQSRCPTGSVYSHSQTSEQFAHHLEPADPRNLLEDVDHADELQTILDKLLPSLSTVETKVYQLMYLDGLKQTEVARRLKVSDQRISEVHQSIFVKAKRLLEPDAWKNHVRVAEKPKKLSKFEARVWHLYFERGMGMAQISTEYQIDYGRLDNAIQRIKHKQKGR